MPTRFNSRSSSNPRKGGLQQCTLSLLTAAMILAGVQAAPALAATDEQPATRSVVNESYSCEADSKCESVALTTTRRMTLGYRVKKPTFN